MAEITPKIRSAKIIRKTEGNKEPRCRRLSMPGSVGQRLGYERLECDVE